MVEKMDIKLENKSVMVTGGAGFIGSHLVDRLIQEKPRNLVVVDNFFLGKESNLLEAKANFPGLKIYHQDASDYETMKKLTKDEEIQVVFNLAVVPLPVSFDRPRLAYEENMAIVLCLLELIRNHGFETLIHFSSSEVYGTSLYAPMDENHPLNGTTPYAISKIAADQLILSYRNIFGIDTAILRPFNNYGPRQNEGSYAGVIPLTIKRILAGATPVIYGDGKQTRDYIFVTDTADAAVRLYECRQTRGRVLNIGSGKEASINTVVQLIAKYLNCDKPIDYQAPRPADVKRHISSIYLAEDLIGFKPSIYLEDGLKMTVEWYKRLRTAR
jgi:UDP-glucose 4-epimerase